MAGRTCLLRLSWGKSMPAPDPKEIVMSYNRVRVALGVLGLSLPFTLLFAALFDTKSLEPTISDFFHTIYRDVYVGTLFAIGTFLVSYRGYRREPGEWIDDDWLATLAGAAAIGMALFPTSYPGAEITTMTQARLGLSATAVPHYVCAFIFFVCLAGFCHFKFAKTRDRRRRRVYRACGWTIVAALVATAIAVGFRREWLGSGAPVVDQYKLIFWFEAVGACAFAISWLTKAKADMAILGQSKGAK